MFFKREALHGAERNEPPAGVEQQTAKLPDDKELLNTNKQQNKQQQTKQTKQTTTTLNQHNY